MKLSECLANFSSSVVGALDCAPDEYNPVLVESYGSMERTYKGHKASTIEDWAAVRSRLKRDIDKIEFIDAKLKEAFDAFDRCDKDVGRKAMLAIYNLQLKKLR